MLSIFKLFSVIPKFSVFRKKKHSIFPKIHGLTFACEVKSLTNLIRSASLDVAEVLNRPQNKQK